MDIALDVAFVLAVTAFVKEQAGLKGRAVLIVVFLIALVFGVAPLIAQLFPAAAPFIGVFLKVVVLFLGAAGSYDAVTGFMRKSRK